MLIYFPEKKKEGKKKKMDQDPCAPYTQDSYVLETIPETPPRDNKKRKCPGAPSRGGRENPPLLDDTDEEGEIMDTPPCSPDLVDMADSLRKENDALRKEIETLKKESELIESKYSHVIQQRDNSRMALSVETSKHNTTKIAYEELKKKHQHANALLVPVNKFLKCFFGDETKEILNNYTRDRTGEKKE